MRTARPRYGPLAVTIAAIASLVLPLAARADLPAYQLIPGTAVLYTQGSGGGGNGGNTSSTSNATNIFSPAAYVDYKLFGGEPTTVVDRYPFVPGPFSYGATATSYKDNVYVSAPQGFVYPRYSTFTKSSDRGETFRVPEHVPIFGGSVANSGGGGDSHIAVGPITHRVFFVDLSVQCVTMNISSDLGENFTTDPLGCGLNPSALDDRQWVAVDEGFPGTSTIPAANTTCLSTQSCGNVYVSFDNDQNLAAPTLALARSTHDGAPGTFATDSVCNLLTNQTGATINPAPSVGASDNTPTPCPDPSDSEFYIAGSVIVDQQATHNVYIPFERFDGTNFLLYLAKSTDGGTTWTRHLVANVGPRDPAYIFPNLAIDSAGNLYYDWAMSQTFDVNGNTQNEGETDVYYTYSTNGGASWVPPIDLTPETGDSAVFPWMVGGSPGQVDLTFYKANTGLNPNVAVTSSGGANPSVWNVYFAQSQNALNPGANFKTVQISDEPNHIGQICTGGIGCSSGGNRDLLDFFTIDVDHLGAANISWADDNNSYQTTFDKFSRQLSGNSIFANTSINLMSQWPITDHAVSDPVGDVYDAAGLPDGSCPGMDITGVSEKYSGTLLTINLSLNGPPTKADAIACGSAATGGVWGAEFWATSPDGNNNFYVAYDDNATYTGPDAGRVRDVNVALTSHEFQRDAGATAATTVSGTCFPAGQPSTATGPCTITLTTDLSTMGVKSGAGLYSITGLSLYYLGSNNRVQEQTAGGLVNIQPGDTEQADAATAFDDNGTGTTSG